MEMEKLWQTALGELEVILSKANFTTWFKDTFIISFEDDILVVAVPNSFALEWLKNKYHDQICQTLKKFNPQIKDVKYKISARGPVLEKDDFKNQPQSNEINNQKSEERVTYNLNPNFTFNNYVVGNYNRLAHAAGMAICNDLGKKYNPLFIYGGVGLGKTHLIHAIGNEIIKLNSKKRIIYAPCEMFANEFIESIQTKKIETFKKKYRNADVLLIDDIQFLSGKEGTQEEFFHTFNALFQNNKQIILTSDRVPQAIPELAGRLSSRFAGGMVADIKQPDLETRKAILKNKCEGKNLELNQEIIDYIAQNICSNIRELEGAINKICTHSELYSMDLTLNNITQILEPLVSPNKNLHITAGKIIKVVVDFFGIKNEALIGSKRNKELVYPRQIVMYLLRRELNYSYPRIGKELGGKDHTTIIHGVRKIEKELNRNEQLQRELSLIKEKLYL